MLTLTQVISQVKGIPFLEDVSFWHFIATFFGLMLYNLAKKSYSKLEANQETLVQILNKVTATQQLHELRIETLEGNNNEIKSDLKTLISKL